MRSATDSSIKQTFILCLVSCLLTPAFNARAEQGGAGHYVSGQTSDFAGMPPTAPGFYFGNYIFGYDNGTFGGNRVLPLGGIFAAGVTADLLAEAPFAIYAYPLNLQDVTLSSGIAVPFVWADVKAGAVFNKNNLQLSRGKEQSASGLGDIQMMPIMASWTNGDVKLGGLLNVWAPSGEYQSGQLANPGLGYWTFGPMLAFSWLSSKIGTEFSAFAGLDFNTKNDTTDYQSGDIFHLDATLAQHLPLFGGFVGAGATAFYVKQITGDSGSGARVGSFEAESYGVGPTVSYVHPIGKSTLVFDGSWLPQLHTENSPKGDYWWVKLSVAF